MVSYVAALLAAVANAVSNVLNRKATSEEPAKVQFRPRLILDLLQRRVWLIAVGIMLLSFVFGAVALGTGQIATVQIIIILELPMTLLGGARYLGGHLGRREWVATVAMTAGVAGVLACLNPQSGSNKPVPATDWIVGSAVIAGMLLALFLAAKMTRIPSRRALLLGAACGLGYGLASAYTKGMTQQFTSGGLIGALSSWELYAAGVAGLLATWLLQNAYHAGRLAAAQPGITLLDPAVATVWGVLAFGEKVQGGIALGLAVIPLLALVAGVIVLSRSPVLQAAAGEGEYGADAKPPSSGDQEESHEKRGAREQGKPRGQGKSRDHDTVSARGTPNSAASSRSSSAKSHS